MSDDEMRKQILDALRWEPLITRTDIVVKVNDGLAILQGTVPNHAEKIMAQHVVERIAGEHVSVTDLRVREREQRNGRSLHPHGA
jgi:osmotically-inducible protein OsmY